MFLLVPLTVTVGTGGPWCTAPFVIRDGMGPPSARPMIQGSGSSARPRCATSPAAPLSPPGHLISTPSTSGRAATGRRTARIRARPCTRTEWLPRAQPLWLPSVKGGTPVALPANAWLGAARRRPVHSTCGVAIVSGFVRDLSGRAPVWACHGTGVRSWYGGPRARTCLRWAAGLLAACAAVSHGAGRAPRPGLRGGASWRRPPPVDAGGQRHAGRQAGCRAVRRSAPQAGPQRPAALFLYGPQLAAGGCASRGAVAAGLGVAPVRPAAPCNSRHLHAQCHRCHLFLTRAPRALARPTGSHSCETSREMGVWCSLARAQRQR